jgi:hypothetical protein
MIHDRDVLMNCQYHLKTQSPRATRNYLRALNQITRWKFPYMYATVVDSDGDLFNIEISQWPVILGSLVFS